MFVLQLSSWRVQVCLSMGYLVRSMLQATVVVILQRGTGIGRGEGSGGWGRWHSERERKKGWIESLWKKQPFTVSISQSIPVSYASPASSLIPGVRCPACTSLSLSFPPSLSHSLSRSASSISPNTLTFLWLLPHDLHAHLSSFHFSPSLYFSFFMTPHVYLAFLLLSLPFCLSFFLLAPLCGFIPLLYLSLAPCLSLRCLSHLS